MAIAVPIETTARGLKRLLNQLDVGGTVTLVGSEGMPPAFYSR